MRALLLSARRRATICAVSLVAIAGCDEQTRSTHDGDEARTPTSSTPRTPSSSDERSTVSCHPDKDERVCAVHGALTPFVVRELLKGHALRSSTLVLRDASATNLAEITALAEDLTALRIEPPEGRRPDLTMLTTLTNLRELDLVYSWSKKVATTDDLTPVARLVGLRKLSIAGAQLGDLGFLGPLASLEELELGNSSIRSLDGIAPHPALRKLYLNNVYERADAGLSSLKALSALEEVHLRLEGRGCDLSWVTELANLTYLSISAFRCASETDVGLFARIPKLDRLRLQGIQVTTVGPLGAAPRLRDLFLESLGNGLKDVPELAKAPKLERLYVSESSLADVSIFASFTPLKRLEVYSQQPLVNMDALASLSKLEALGLYVYTKTGSVDELPFLEKLPALKTVALKGDFVKRPAVAKLRAKHPALEFQEDLPP